MSRKILALAPILLGIACGTTSAQEEGQVLFNNACRTCHTLEEGDNRLGPTLHNVIGRKAGSLPEFPYSDALRNSNIVWDEANLDRFIENPDAVVGGNKMKPYAGMTSAEDRAAIVAFLAEQSGTGAN
jgi:cytochrome c